MTWYGDAHADDQEIAVEAQKPAPRLLVAEHTVRVASLPRGPRTVANAVAPTWTAEWWHSETERQDNPKQGGVAYGVRFVHVDGRHGWAIWLNGSFVTGFIYASPRNYVPRGLKAAELKETLANG